MLELSRLSQRRQAEKWLQELLHQHEQRRGFLIAFEGPDGSGKTTQRKLFKRWLKEEGHEVATTKWNSSPLISPLVKVRKKARTLNPEEFCLLHAADFRHRIETLIVPALLQGKTVVADRYLFTALARDCARGLELDWLLHLFSPFLWPDLVFYFSVSPATSAQRIALHRTPKFYEAGQDVTQLDDPFESYSRFMTRVIQEYEALALIFKFVTIDAEQSIYDQHQQIRTLFQQCQRRPWADWNLKTMVDWVGLKVHIPDVRLGDGRLA